MKLGDAFGDDLTASRWIRCVSTIPAEPTNTGRPQPTIRITLPSRCDPCFIDGPRVRENDNGARNIGSAVRKTFNIKLDGRSVQNSRAFRGHPPYTGRRPGPQLWQFLSESTWFNTASSVLMADFTRITAFLTACASG